MSTFPLRIGTPDGLLFEGNVERVVCRSIGGDIAILARHCNFCTALGMGEASVVMEDGTRRTAACIGGMLSVMNGTCRLLATTWEWKEDINEERAQAARKRAEEMIAKGGQCRRVVYTPGQSTWAAMRYTGEYQIRQSREEELTIELGLAGCFPAFPGDTVRLELGAMGLSGEYRVAEAENTASPETGEVCTLILRERI